jgi:hypothetical protein
LVLIFDGLDEQAVTGRASDDLVRDFMIKLTQLTSSLRGERNCRLRAIVTGRMPSFQAAQRYASGLRRAYEVIGFLPLTNPVVQQLFANVKGEEQRGLTKLDQRVLWWERYITAVTGERSKPPKSLTDASLAEIAHEPLLCYLLVLSGYATDDVQAVAANRNVIYRKLVDEVWRRGWGDGQGSHHREGPGKFLDQEGFNILMETIALAGWKGGDTRVCTEQGFLIATKALRSEQAWEQFVEDNGTNIINLAINFYLKRSDIDARGFEFLTRALAITLPRELCSEWRLTSPALRIGEPKQL